MSKRKEELLTRVVMEGEEGFSSLFGAIWMKLGLMCNEFKKQPGVDNIDLYINTSLDTVKDATDKIMKYCNGGLPQTRDELFNAIKYGFFYQPKFNNIEVSQIKAILQGRYGLSYSYSGGNMFSPIIPKAIQDSDTIDDMYLKNRMVYKSDDDYNGSNMEIEVNNKIMYLAL